MHELQGSTYHVYESIRHDAALDTAQEVAAYEKRAAHIIHNAYSII